MDRALVLFTFAVSLGMAGNPQAQVRQPGSCLAAKPVIPLDRKVFPIEFQPKDAPAGLVQQFGVDVDLADFRSPKTRFQLDMSNDPFDSSTTSYPPRSTSLFNTSISRTPFRHMKASSWPRKIWPSACSRRLESNECAELSILAGISLVRWFRPAGTWWRDPINELSANALPLAGKSSRQTATPTSFRNAVNIILFWDNPIMGSACPANGIWHPRYRQIRPFS
jgi:hypothetical protein